MRYSTAAILIATALMILGCRTVTGPGGQPIDQNLIANSSFEQNGSPSIAGWQQSFPDTGVIHYSTDVPPGGGSYSLALNNQWGPLPQLQTFVAASPGIHRYQATLWSKVLPSVPYSVASGGLRIIHKRADTLVYRKTMFFGDSTWTEHSLLDTITTQPGDSLAISLAGGQTQWSFGLTLFDLVRFLKLD